MIIKMAKHLQRNMQRDSKIEPNFHRLTHIYTYELKLLISVVSKNKEKKI